MNQAVRKLLKTSACWTQKGIKTVITRLVTEVTQSYPQAQLAQ